VDPSVTLHPGSTTLIEAMLTGHPATPGFKVPKKAGYVLSCSYNSGQCGAFYMGAVASL
jgi:hypothetical protein